MSIELERDIIRYEKLIGEGQGQTMVDGDIVISERNPEIATILSTDGKVSIVSSEVVEDRVIIEGKMSFDIFYTSKEEEPGIYKVSASSNFTHNMEVPGSQPNMFCRLAADVEHMDNEVVSGKKIKVSSIINIKGAVYEREEFEAIKDIRGSDVQILKDSKPIDEFLGENNAQSVVKGTIEVPEDEPEVNSLLKSNVHIHKKDVTIQENKVVINACALIRVLYNSADNKLCTKEQDVPFTQEMNIENLKPDAKCDVDFKVNDAEGEVKENENGEKRVIELELMIDVGAKLYAKRDVETIIDAYSPQERYDLEKQSIKPVGILGEGLDNQTVKEKISIPDEMSPIAEVKNVDANATVTDVKIVEDKVLVEGIVSCCAIYNVASDEGGIASYTEEIPFKSSIEMPGANIDMMYDANANVEHVSYNMASNREIEVKVTVEAGVKVYSRSSMDVVKNVEQTDMSENIKNMPSLTIYVVQQKDTLWNIAKKYSTTIEDIVNMNEITDAENVQPGSKLVIPKKMFMK